MQARRSAAVSGAPSVPWRGAPPATSVRVVLTGVATSAGDNAATAQILPAGARR